MFLVYSSGASMMEVSDIRQLWPKTSHLLKNTFMYTCILCIKILFWFILCFTVNLPTLHLTATCNCGRLSHVGSPTCCLHQMLPVYLLSAAHDHHHHQNHLPPCNQHHYYYQHIIMKFNMGIIAKAIS